MIWNGGLTLAVISVAIVSRPRGDFGEINVERINVVDGNGTRRMVITNRDRFPDLVIDGKTGPRSARSVQPAGIVLYDEQGNEAGGYGTTKTADGAAGSMMVLDYARSEAIGIVQRHTEQDAWAELVINESSPPGPQRIALAARGHASQIELADGQGRPRIRLQVDAQDQPSIAILDEAGREVRRLP